MFWSVLLLFASPLYSLLRRLLKDDRHREILALRQQIFILRRRLGKRPRLSRRDRIALLLSCFGMKRRQLVDALLIVRPATLAHRSKGLGVLSGDTHFPQVGKVARRNILGGLVNDYFRKAAWYAGVQHLTRSFPTASWTLLQRPA